MSPSRTASTLGISSSHISRLGDSKRFSRMIRKRYIMAGLRNDHIREEVKGVASVGHGMKRKSGFMKNHVSGHDKFPGCHAVKLITLHTCWISEEHTRRSSWRKLVTGRNQGGRKS